MLPSEADSAGLDSVLPEEHLKVPAPLLPVCALLFGIRVSSYRQVRLVEGRLDGSETDQPMSSPQPWGPRPGALGTQRGDVRARLFGWTA